MPVTPNPIIIEQQGADATVTSGVLWSEVAPLAPSPEMFPLRLSETSYKDGEKCLLSRN